MPFACENYQEKYYRYPEIVILFRIFPFEDKTDCVHSPILMGHTKHHNLPTIIKVKASDGCQISQIIVIANGIPSWKRRSDELERPK